MSKPTIETRAFGYIFTWEQEQIQAKVGLIRLHRAGNVTAEVQFSTTSPQWESGFLHRSHLNLSSTTSMKQTAKFLTDRYDPELLSDTAWGEIIEQLCYFTINLMRVGDEAVEVWPQDEEVPEPTYVLDPVLQENQANLFFGEKTAGKTQLALLCCAIISLPWYDNPFGLIVPDHPVKSLWLDWETDPASFRYLYNELQRGLGQMFGPIAYRRCRTSLPDDVEQVAHWIEQTEAKFIVVDHIGLAAGGPLNEDVTATTYFEAVRQLNITSLHLSHQSKNPETKRRSTFGSVFWENIPRTVWEIKKVSDNESTLDTVMVLTKRNIGKRPRPYGFQFSYNGAGTQVATFNPNDIPEFVQDTSASNRIYLYLQKEGPCLSSAIIEDLELPKATVYKTLERLEKKGKVIKVGNQYALAGNDE